MAQIEPLGIKRLESIHYYVHDLERSRRFYTEKLDFQELAESDERLTKEGKQRSALFQAGQCVVLVSEPVGEGGRAWRYLRKHPDGVGALIFEVEDIEKTFRLLEARGGTPIDDIQRFTDDGGTLSTFSITTPFGDTTFRFVERNGYRGIYPGLKVYETPKGGDNACKFQYFDHVTSNFQTMKPALLWLEHVMGFEEFWGVEFHTKDVATLPHEGSGLRSTVMWDPHSGVKFANNEPWRPHFKTSQINIFNEDHKGDGVQHLALACEDLIHTVRVLRERGVEFMPTPGTYYDALPERLKKMGIDSIDEDIEELRDLEILVDGDGEKGYLLQIFLRDSAGLYHEPSAGPFFYELIQRKGDQGFGAGNFRALFESIERQQKMEGRI
ncbi:MAG: 4-hydroxyphenylpyruvate dioxygenase [Deltaproteobacteria bacterium]|nr:MAG: 4-hydroxyphenylpyruvate dioxygenase [Deltaproteobacteria bacterium]